MDLPEIQEIDPKKVIEAKLYEALKNHRGEFIVEDTSLEFKCLNGLPGTLIKWFLKKLEPMGIYNLVSKYADRTAIARSYIGYVKQEKGSDDITVEFFVGEIEGEIVKPTEPYEFGWDPLFKPKGYDVTFAHMSKEEKNKISHRRKAFERLKKYLQKN